MSLPNVLIVGQPFTRHKGGGITLSNLFAGWDRDKLAVVCADYMFDGNVDTEICDNYYRLGVLEHRWAFPFSLLKSKHPSGPVTFPKRTQQRAAPTIGKPPLRKKLVVDYFIPGLRYLGLFHLVAKITLSDQLRRWLDEYQPEVIYAQAPTRSMVLFCLALQQYLGKPMIYHLMDDWPATIGEKGLMKKYWSRVVDRDMRRLLDRAAVFLSISDFMSQEYERRYGRESVAFHNPIEVDFWKQHQRRDYELADPPTLLYAGRTGLGIDASLKTIAQAVERVNGKLDCGLRFILQTERKPAWVNRYDCVDHRSLVPYEDLPRVFAEADFLILPYDFSPQALKFIKFSMPTKAPEFMASGSPILIFAPEDTAIVNYASTHGWAEVVTENEVERLAAAIGRLLQDKNARASLGQRAIALAETRHDAQKVTRAFREVIRSVSAGKATV